jgi:hypothetical protein
MDSASTAIIITITLTAIGVCAASLHVATFHRQINYYRAALYVGTLFGVLTNAIVLDFLYNDYMGAFDWEFIVGVTTNRVAIWLPKLAILYRTYRISSAENHKKVIKWLMGATVLCFIATTISSDYACTVYIVPYSSRAACADEVDTLIVDLATQTLIEIAISYVQLQAFKPLKDTVLLREMKLLAFSNIISIVTGSCRCISWMFATTPFAWASVSLEIFSIEFTIYLGELYVYYLAKTTLATKASKSKSTVDESVILETVEASSASASASAAFA